MNSCYACGSSDLEQLPECYRCRRCGLVRTAYSYDASQYNFAYAKTYLNYASGPVNIPLQLLRLGLVARWLRLNEKLLDVGCCIGEFISFARYWFECYGVEPNDAALQIARKRQAKWGLQRQMFSSSLNGQFPRMKCITLFDVLEHFEDPKLALQSFVENWLSPEGVVVVTTPNVGSICSHEMASWRHYKPKEHLFLFTPDSLGALFKEAGLSVVHLGFEESDVRPDNPNGGIMTLVGKK